MPEVFVLNQKKEKARSRPHGGVVGVMPLPSTSGIERICISLWRMPMPSCYLTYAQSRKATWSEYTSRPGCWLCQRRCGRWLRTYTDSNGLGSYWVQMVDALRADLRSYGQADPAALQSRVPAHPPPPIQGTPTPLPVTQFGASGQATTVVVGQTPSSRSRPRRPRPPARRLRTPPCPRAAGPDECGREEESQPELEEGSVSEKKERQVDRRRARAAATSEVGGECGAAREKE